MDLSTIQVRNFGAETVFLSFSMILGADWQSAQPNTPMITPRNPKEPKNKKIGSILELNQSFQE